MFYNNKEMDNRKDLEFYDILHSLHGKQQIKICDKLVLVIVLRLRPDVEASTNYIDVYGALKCPDKLRLTLEQVRQGFNRQLIP